MPNPFTPRLNAQFVSGGAAAFLRPSAGNRGGVGKLPSSTSEALAIINSFRAEGAEPLTEESVYIHYLEAANNAFVSDRYCFLGETTLKNIATDAAAGFAFMNSHRTGGYGSSSELPLGRTFCGRYERVTPDGDGEELEPADTEGSTRRAVVGIYMLAGVAPNGSASISTDDMHRSIDARTIFDCSVGLYGGTAICDVCGHGVWDYDRESGRFLCPHMPGTDYQMTPEQVAAQVARGVTNGYCSYTLDGANCNEVSAVYDGAVPGAGFVKAALSPIATSEDLAAERESLVSKLSAGYGLPFTVSDLAELAQRFQKGTTEVPASPKAEKPLNHSTPPDADPPGSKEKKTMKLSLKALREALGLGENEQIVIEGDNPTTPAPTPAPADFTATITAAVNAAVAPLNTQLQSLAESNKSLGEQLAASQKTAEETAKAAQLAADKAKILALKKAFKITPAAAIELEKLAEEAPAAFAIAAKAFESNGPVITVAGIPGYSVTPPSAMTGDELVSDDPTQLTETLENLAKAKTAANPKLAYHDAVQEVLRERPDLGNAYAASRGVN